MVNSGNLYNNVGAIHSQGRAGVGKEIAQGWRGVPAVDGRSNVCRQLSAAGRRGCCRFT